MKKIIYSIIFAAVALTACKKPALVESTKYQIVNAGDPEFAYLKIINLSQASPVLTFFADDTKFSSQLSAAGKVNTGHAYNGIFPDLGYATLHPGEQTLKAKIVAGAATDPDLEVLASKVTLNAGKYYSFFPNGLYTAATKKIPASVLVEDIKPATDTTKIYVRFANFYQGSAPLTLYRGKPEALSVLVSGIETGKVSNWIEVAKPGNGITPTVTYHVYAAGEEKPVTTATGANLALLKGGAYTIYCRGIKGNTSYPFAITAYTTFY